MCAEQIKLRDGVVYRQAKGYFTVRDLCAVLSDYQNLNDNAGVGETYERKAGMSRCITLRQQHACKALECSCKALVCFKDLLCKGFVDDATTGVAGDSSSGGTERVPTFLSFWLSW